MKRFLVLGLLLSFGVSAKTVCFLNESEDAIAIQMTSIDGRGQMKIRKYEFVPQQYLCASFSSSERLLYTSLFIENCQGEVKGRGTFTLYIEASGCRLLR